jgi:hypothetical protein
MYEAVSYQNCGPDVKDRFLAISQYGIYLLSSDAYNTKAPCSRQGLERKHRTCFNIVPSFQEFPLLRTEEEENEETSVLYHNLQLCMSWLRCQRRLAERRSDISASSYYILAIKWGENRKAKEKRVLVVTVNTPRHSAQNITVYSSTFSCSETNTIFSVFPR